VTLTRPLKLILAALTLWPIAYLFLFLAFALTAVFWMGRSGSSATGHSGPPLAFLLLFAAHILTIFLIFALVAFYVVFLFKTDRVRQDKKALWAAVLFLGHMVAMPVFFYIYVWPESWPRHARPGSPSAGDSAEPGLSPATPPGIHTSAIP
jgi:hypothetical protein